MPDPEPGEIPQNRCNPFCNPYIQIMTQEEQRLADDKMRAEIAKAWNDKKYTDKKSFYLPAIVFTTLGALLVKLFGG
ncbi:MAG: hypothetical protein GDA35_10925 [Hyphomonadaceae bacterium]|nr:hypothetical protein [Hyphomonadaceae bacterium]